jgi:hypothetical protein
MNIPWFRLFFMLAFMRKGEDAEGQLAHVAHFALSWGLTEAVTPLSRALVLNAQARRGEITHTHARAVRHPPARPPHACVHTHRARAWRRKRHRRGAQTLKAVASPVVSLPTHSLTPPAIPSHTQAGKVRVASVALASGIAAVALGLLLWHGHSQMPLFLLFTTFVLPLFQAATWPRAWPAAPLLVVALAAIWAWEGVRPLFVGLYLFQAVPVAQALLTQACRGYRFASIFLWWAAAATAAPLVVVAVAAMYAPEALFSLAELRPPPPPAVAGAAAAPPPPPPIGSWPGRFLALQRALGAGRGPDDPWRVLGVPRGAAPKEIRKRFRELSLQYHPDKTGNNPMLKARFLQIQAAAERLTKKEWTADAAKAAMEEARDAASRCVECIFVVGIWWALSAFGWVASFFAASPQQQAAQQAAAAAAAVAAAGGGGAVAAPEVRIGPSFMGASMLGLAAPTAVRGAAVAQPLPRVGVAAAAPAAQPAAVQPAGEEAGSRAGGGALGGKARKRAAAAAAAPAAGAGSAAPVAGPQLTPLVGAVNVAPAAAAAATLAAAPPPSGVLARTLGWVLGRPRGPPEKRVTGKERRAARRAGDATPAAES